MSKRLFGLVVLMVVMLFSSQVVFAQGAGEFAAEWLAISVGARPTAMGESYAAVGDDASAIFWNPAGIVGSGKMEFMFQYGMLPAGIGYHAVSLVMPMGGGGGSVSQAFSMASAMPQQQQQQKQYSPYEQYTPQYFASYPTVSKAKKGMSGSAIGLGLSYLDSGSMDGFDEYGDPDIDFAVAYYCAMLSFSQAMGESMAIGVTGKMINETVDVDSASTFAADAGILLKAGGSLSVGAAVQNLGASLNGSALPMNIKAGVGFGGGALTVSADVNMSGGDTKMSVGAEMNMGGLALRGGYILGMDDMGDAALLMPGMALGFGVDTESLCLDLALVDYGDLGDGVGPFNMPLRASLIFKF
jgi:hypothetical protein